MYVNILFPHLLLLISKTEVLDVRISKEGGSRSLERPCVFCAVEWSMTRPDQTRPEEGVLWQKSGSKAYIPWLGVCYSVISVVELTR